MEDLNIEVLQISDNQTMYKCYLIIDDHIVSRASISVSDNTTWQISSWYTDNEYKNKGYGKKTINYLINYIIEQGYNPSRIEYIWNGANEYVGDWLKRNFNAESTCPLAVRKYSSSDDWSSHIYELDTEMFKEYFNIHSKTR